MIAVTRFDGSQIYLNADLIEIVESNPDTHVTLVNGHRYLVRESDADVVARVIEYHQATGVGQRSGRRSSAALRAVPSDD